MPTTIFPVKIKGIIHAAFVLDYKTNKFATMCGKMVANPDDVEHRVTEVECKRCAEALR